MKKTFILIARIQIVVFAIFAVGNLIAVVELIKYGYNAFFVFAAVMFFISSVIMMLVGFEDLND